MLPVFLTACSETGDRKNVGAGDASDYLANRSINVPDGFSYVKGFRWPIAFAGSAAYALRYDGPAEANREIESTRIGSKVSPFIKVACDAASIPANLALDELGFHCPAAGTVHIARTQTAVTPEESLTPGESAAIVTSTTSNTHLFIVYTGT